jgi:hypothetical protein
MGAHDLSFLSGRQRSTVWQLTSGKHSPYISDIFVGDLPLIMTRLARQIDVHWSTGLVDRFTWQTTYESNSGMSRAFCAPSFIWTDFIYQTFRTVMSDHNVRFKSVNAYLSVSLWV